MTFFERHNSVIGRAGIKKSSISLASTPNVMTILTQAMTMRERL